MRSSALPALLALLCSSPLAAQRDTAAGFSAETLRIDLDPLTGSPEQFGIQHLNGEIFAPYAAAPHAVAVFDASGSLLRTFAQPGSAAGTAQGFLDGASDGVSLCFAFSLGIQVLDANGNVVSEILTQNDPLPGSGVPVSGGLISGDVLAPGNLSQLRALAFDRSGNGGNGSFWTADLGSSVFEIDVQVDVLRSFHNVGETSDGFGLDPLTGNLWINAGRNGVLAEYDPRRGVFTGSEMDQEFGSAGGLDIIPGNLTRGALASGWDVLHLQQGTPDRASVRRLHLDVAGIGLSTQTRPGTTEPSLIGTIDDATFFPFSDDGVHPYVSTSASLDWDIDISADPGDGLGTGGLNGTVAVVFGNLGADAVPDATSSLVRELVHLNVLGASMPFAASPPPSRSLVLSNDPMNPSVQSFAIGSPPPTAIGDCIRLQAAYVDPRVDFLPLAMTNQIRFCRDPDPVTLSGLFAEAIGANSFNADVSSGFFSVTNEATDPNQAVVRVRCTVFPANASARTQAIRYNGFRWDTDNPSMAEVFEGGDSPNLACQGTYRNGSEVSTGLVFAGTAQQNATPCDASALQGWVGSDAGFNDGDWRTLEFTFNPSSFMNGAVFEFDADTDGGLGTSGADMAGVVIEVELADGSVVTGELVGDVNNPTRSFVQL